MMALPHEFLLRDYAMVWSVTGRDAYGQPEYGTGVVARCLWFERPGRVLRATGEVAATRVEVYFDDDFEIEPGDRIVRTFAKDGGPPAGPSTKSIEVLTVERVPTLTGHVVVVVRG